MKLGEIMKVAINGFGRIGRNFFKAAMEKKLNITAINDLTDTKTLAYLLKYDSVFGRYNKKIAYTNDSLIVDGRKIRVLAIKEPGELPWKQLGIDVVVESTGRFESKKDAEKHLMAGAKKVVISAPSDDSDFTAVMGVNHDKIASNHKVVSMASCTTNCLAVMVKVLDDSFGINEGFVTTVHAYTATQSLVDGPARSLRRGRAAAVSIIPSTSGATTATIRTVPWLTGKLDGLALRVPVLDGSITDFVAYLKKDVTVEKINNEFKKAANGKLKGILDYTDEQIVSVDIIGNPASCVFDATGTQVLGKRFVKVLGWYDNEWGYSNRLVDFVKHFGRK